MKSFLGQLAVIPLLFIIAAIFFGPALVCWQIYYWLKSGAWFPIPVSKALEYMQWPYPNLEWRGVQKILDYFLDLPLSAVIWLLAMSLFALGIIVVDSFDDKVNKKSL